jgi:hypothetical protein
MKLGCSGYLTKKMRMVKTSLKPYMLFLEEEYFFCKAVREKNNSVKDNSKLIKNITTAHQF